MSMTKIKRHNAMAVDFMFSVRFAKLLSREGNPKQQKTIIRNKKLLGYIKTNLKHGTLNIIKETTVNRIVDNTTISSKMST